MLKRVLYLKIMKIKLDSISEIKWEINNPALLKKNLNN